MQSPCGSTDLRWGFRVPHEGMAIEPGRWGTARGITWVFKIYLMAFFLYDLCVSTVN